MFVVKYLPFVVGFYTLIKLKGMKIDFRKSSVRPPHRRMNFRPQAYYVIKHARRDLWPTSVYGLGVRDER